MKCSLTHFGNGHEKQKIYVLRIEDREEKRQGRESGRGKKDERTGEGKVEVMRALSDWVRRLERARKAMPCLSS